MPTPEERAALEADKAGKYAIEVRAEIANASTHANNAADDARRVLEQVANAESFSDESSQSSITSDNYKQESRLWANADYNVQLQPGLYSAKHYAKAILNSTGVVQDQLNVLVDDTAADKETVDNALNIIQNRLNTGDVNYDTTAIEQNIVLLNTGYNTLLSSTLLLAQYNQDTLDLANFSKSRRISLENKLIENLDESGQSVLKALLRGASNATKVSYAGVVVDQDTGLVTNAAGSALSTEYGIRMATIEEILDGQGKYAVKVNNQLNKDVAAVELSLDTKIESINENLSVVNASYTVVVDASGHVAGFQLATSPGYSNFTVNADSFKIANQEDTVTPFRVVTGAGVCILSDGTETGNQSEAECTALDPNGVWLSPGVRMTEVTLDAINIVGSITSDKITMDGTISLIGEGSGLAASKMSLADASDGCFYGKSGIDDGNPVSGIHISSDEGFFYVDTRGYISASDVTIHTGVAGEPVEREVAGTYAIDIHPLSRGLNIIAVGGGAGANSNLYPSTQSTVYPTAGESGGDTIVEFWSGRLDTLTGLNTGMALTRITAEGGRAEPHDTYRSISYTPRGKSGRRSIASRREALGGTRSIAAQNGDRGGSGGCSAGGGVYEGGRASPDIRRTGIIYFSGGPGAGYSETLNIPAGAQSIKITVGRGGRGGIGLGLIDAVPLVSGRGGDGYVSITDVRRGGESTSLVDLIRRVELLEAA